MKFIDKWDKRTYVGIVTDNLIELKIVKTNTDWIKYNELLCFYKPDAQGNYIKVWEEK